MLPCLQVQDFSQCSCHGAAILVPGFCVESKGNIQCTSSLCLDAGQSKCRLERAQALEQAKKPQEAVFVPECGEDGSFTQVRLLHTGFSGHLLD